MTTDSPGRKPRKKRPRWPTADEVAAVLESQAYPFRRRDLEAWLNSSGTKNLDGGRKLSRAERVAASFRKYVLSQDRPAYWRDNSDGRYDRARDLTFERANLSEHQFN